METKDGGTSGREARRRRIVERGSDRMALITGQNKSYLSPKHSHTQSSPAIFFEDQSLPQSPVTPFDRFHIDHKGEDDSSDTPTKHDINDRYSRGNAFGSRVEPQLRKCETNVGAVQPVVVSPKVPKASVDEEVPSKACDGRHNVFTAKEINSCIMASESTRVFCSVIIALLVVLSYTNLPHNIVKSQSTIASRPLYILLLTDVTIVLVRLLEKRRSSEKIEEEIKPGLPEDGENWKGAVKILEMGLVFYQTLRAVFIDCSFYMVVVICGLSLV